MLQFFRFWLALKSLTVSNIIKQQQTSTQNNTGPYSTRNKQQSTTINAAQQQATTINIEYGIISPTNSRFFFLDVFNTEFVIPWRDSSKK
jgi:hypothetical protein